jgi:hypothetical protein
MLSRDAPVVMGKRLLRGAAIAYPARAALATRPASNAERGTPKTERRKA